MKTIYNIKALFVIGLAGVAGVLNAQEVVPEETNLNRELTLEREYDPSVQDANKVNTLPEVKEPQVQRRSIDYASFTLPIDPAKEITILPSGSIYTDILYNKRRGYFNVAAGTYANINGDLGYHVLNTEKDQLNIFFSHRSTNGKVKYLDDSDKVKAKLNDNLGGIGFRHVFNKATMNLGLKYGYTGFNYYGQPFPYSSGYTENSDLDQVNQRFQVNAGVTSNGNQPFGYLLDISYRNFSQKHGNAYNTVDGITEHGVGLRLGANAGFGINQLIGVEGMVNYFNYSTPSEWKDDFKNYAELTVTPYYKVFDDNWNVKIGANVMVITGDNSKIFVSPNIAADVEVADKTVLYLEANGEIRSNSAYEISLYNPYLNPQFRSYPYLDKDYDGTSSSTYPYSLVQLIPSRTWLDGTIGLKSGVAPGFWFNLFAGYKITDRDCFFIQQNMLGYPNVSLAVPVNTKLFKAGLEMKYAWQKLLDISVKGVYNNWNLSAEESFSSALVSEAEPYGRPKFQFNAGLDVRPVDKFTLSFNYLMASGRYAYGGVENIKMKNINELNFTGLYNFNDTFGAYVKLNNLLFQKYELLYGYPLQKFNAMIGVNINF